MNDTCYHCEHEIDKPHSVTFYEGNEERNELLCDSCYDEWLASIKG
ncbi:hypothetical protein [Effusibacillus consociatus]|uniref:Small CPxCG-related zinc finger protein n=1 Tax=Effusibacillus consociatus TaxID=1117041 RepID=A0ABV9Q628_9BACL